MKRSQMIKKICSDLTERFGNLPDYTVLAEIMLCSCEDAGMLPPSTEKAFEFVTLEKDMDLGFALINEWDPEDEKK